MIYTKFGTPVEIVSPFTSDGFVKVRRADGSYREYHISELRADGGVDELAKAANKFLDVPEDADAKIARLEKAVPGWMAEYAYAARVQERDKAIEYGDPPERAEALGKLAQITALEDFVKDRGTGVKY
ncbi:MAG: hypothetical protein WC683_10220 [bacterium]